MTLPELSETELARLRETFKMFDLDNSGKVTAENLTLVMRALGQNPTKVEVEDLLKDKDIDGDGMINFDDFTKMMRVKMATTEVEAELSHAFKMFDRDNSGKINFEELRVALTCIGEKLTDDEVKDMLAEADRNGDGEIDYEEFVQMMSH
ncbi:neo-calmodulin-like isoform X1 [Mizuhopecten yessoensis]|uniref:neo-calmodulin-like isoform X1 n=2 Tax=Mizuhopecten yessoensis TaxID=6573 RepID=UPI000B4578B5|nr:neo-calmodulin-like isoform X1 [Mizuhopecten yessoensis]